MCPSHFADGFRHAKKLIISLSLPSKWAVALWTLEHLKVYGQVWVCEEAQLRGNVYKRNVMAARPWVQGGDSVRAKSIVGAHSLRHMTQQCLIIQPLLTARPDTSLLTIWCDGMRELKSVSTFCRKCIRPHVLLNRGVEIKLEWKIGFDKGWRLRIFNLQRTTWDVCTAFNMWRLMWLSSERYRK